MKITGYETESGNVIAITITDETRGFYDKRFIEDRPHGEWKTEPHSTIIHCSNCDAIENLNRLYVSNFCYSCGADMRPKKKVMRNECKAKI